jgi:hypothetical protein
MWLAPASRPLLEEALFRFLLTVRDNRPQASAAWAIKEGKLAKICADPHPDLRAAFAQCVEALLVEIDSERSARGKIKVPGTVFGLALAVNNCLAPLMPQKFGMETGEASFYDEFTQALVAAVPLARDAEAALAYHAVLRGTTGAVPLLSDERAKLMRALIERSPLTALCALDVHTPSAVETIAAELLPGWKSENQSILNGWSNADAWLETIGVLLRDERIARWVRQRWLVMPETRRACRNTGLLLEALRRRGTSRAFILEFYESYDYFRAQTREGEKFGRAQRFWPILDEIEKLLRTDGESEAALQINRRGNEYFQKFRPLVETVIAENGVPTDYALLSREFVRSLRPLLAFVTEGARQRLSFGALTFGDAVG